MTSQAERKRRRRERNRIRQAESHGEAANSPAKGRKASAAPVEPRNINPTPERASHGPVIPPDGDKPAIALDALARLLAAKVITPEEDEAGREFARICYAARRSMGIRGEGSCLSGGVGAYDTSDGVAGIEAAWRGICAKLTRGERQLIEHVAVYDMPLPSHSWGRLALALRKLVH